jgi:hypothetical protein
MVEIVFFVFEALRAHPVFFHPTGWLQEIRTTRKKADGPANSLLLDRPCFL